MEETVAIDAAPVLCVSDTRGSVIVEALPTMECGAARR
jgi:hypothetical protein